MAKKISEKTLISKFELKVTLIPMKECLIIIIIIQISICHCLSKYSAIEEEENIQNWLIFFSSLLIFFLVDFVHRLNWKQKKTTTTTKTELASLVFYRCCCCCLYRPITQTWRMKKKTHPSMSSWLCRKL